MPGLNWSLAGPGFNALEVLNAAGQAKQQRRQDDMYAARQQAATLAANGDYAGSRRAAIGAGDIDWVKAVGDLQDEQHQQLAREFDTIGTLYANLKPLPQEARAAAAAPVLKQLGVDPSQIDFSDTGLDNYYAMSKVGQAALAARMKANEPRVIGDGGALVDGNGRVIYENQRAPKWQFDSESGSWLQEPGTGGQGYASPQPQPQMGAGMPAPQGRMVDITLQSESGNRDYAAGGGVLTSPAGAKGRMQVLDGTNSDPGFGVRPAANGSLEERARVGRDYLAAMSNRYGNPAQAWAAYNAGPGRVDQAIRNGGENWLQMLPAETQAYVARNMARLGGGQSYPQSQPGVINVRPPKRKDAPSGYEWNGNSLRPIPGGPADPTTSTTRNVQNDRKAETDYRKEFDALPEVKNFKAARQQFNALRDTALNPNATAQDDIAVIFQFMKTLDPTSTVREGEFATAQNAASVPEALRNAFNRAQSGTRLSPEQRQSMVRTAYRNYQAFRDAYNTTAENYRGYARDYGLNPDRVARTYTPDKPAQRPQQGRMGQFRVVKVN